MKKIIFLKGMLSVVMLFIASLTISAAKPGDNLVHNTEEVNGVIISETVFKMDESQKWNSNKNCWENNLCIRYIHGNKSITTEYYKWNSKKKEYILVPEMTVTMDK